MSKIVSKSNLLEVTTQAKQKWNTKISTFWPLLMNDSQKHVRKFGAPMFMYFLNNV